jgi:hypothetical protein
MMKKSNLEINGGAAVRLKRTKFRSWYLTGLVFVVMLAISSPAWAQGSIFGTVTNSDVSTPANGEISFFGFLDDTDEEIRIETSDGAGYDAGNWFDDFQNYLTEAPGNPYDYYFYNIANGEGYPLAARAGRTDGYPRLVHERRYKLDGRARIDLSCISPPGDIQRLVFPD